MIPMPNFGSWPKVAGGRGPQWPPIPCGPRPDPHVTAPPTPSVVTDPTSVIDGARSLRSNRARSLCHRHGAARNGGALFKGLRGLYGRGAKMVQKHVGRFSALVALAVASAPALGESEAVCRAYATKAVAAYQEARSRGCPLANAR